MIFYERQCNNTTYIFNDINTTFAKIKSFCNDISVYTRNKILF